MARRLVLVAEHAVLIGGDGRERRRVIVARGTVFAEVWVAVAARRIELGRAMADLAHAAARVGRARQAARC